MLSKIVLTFALGALIFATGGYGQTASPSSAAQAASSTPPLLKDPNFSIFVQMAKAAGIVDLFQGTGPFTGFIPNNDAFKKLGTQKMNDLLLPKNQDKLVDILTYHIVPGKYLSNTLKTMSLKTINGKYLNIRVENGKIKVNTSNVVRTDIIGPNGVVQEIDTVQFP